MLREPCHMSPWSTNPPLSLTHFREWVFTKGCRDSQRSLGLKSDALSPKPARPPHRALSWSVSFLGCQVPCLWNEVTILAQLRGKESTCNAEGDTGDMGWIPGSGRSPGGGHGNPLQYSCLQNALDRGAWWATVHGVTKSQTRPKRLSTHTHPGQT